MYFFSVEDEDGYYITQMMMNAAEQAEEFAISIWHKFQSWKVIHFSHLPQVRGVPKKPVILRPWPSTAL